jgi:ABC-type cobalamin/Fe3+-siderophores transport system ATPase subunit
MQSDQHWGVGVMGAVVIISVVLAAATVWLFLTDPVTVADAVSQGEVTPFIRDLASVLLTALRSLLRYL